MNKNVKTKVDKLAKAKALKAAAKVASAKAAAIRLARKVKEDKRRKAIHELSFGKSLRSKSDHAEWVKGETSRIQVNADIRARRQAAVEKMFKMREHSN